MQMKTQITTEPELTESDDDDSSFLIGNTKAGVASLSRKEILKMSRQRLIDSLRASDLPNLTRNMLNRLRRSDMTVLRRLLLDARNCCRTQGY